MPKFKFRIARTYSIVEGFEREYEADTPEQAYLLAVEEANESDMDCPDDCSEIESGGASIGDFWPERIA